MIFNFFRCTCMFGNITYQTDRLFSLCFLNLVVLHQFHNALLASTGYVTPKVSGSGHWSDEIHLCSHMFWIPDHFPEFSLLLRPSAVRNWRMRLEMTFQNEFQLHHNVSVWERAGKLSKGSEIKQTQSDQSLQWGSFHQYQRQQRTFKYALKTRLRFICRIFFLFFYININIFCVYAFHLLSLFYVFIKIILVTIVL